MKSSDTVLIGIDIGTTNLKFVAANPGGAVIAVVRRPMVVTRPAPHAADFDLDALRTNIQGGLKELADILEQQSAGKVAAIGIASIGESFVGLDRDGMPITSCPTWFDRRTSNRREALGLTAADWFNITGMVDDDVYTVHRIGWWQEHAPDLTARARHWVMVSDYIVYLLSGAFVATPSLAARSGLADRHSGQWSRIILDAAGISSDTLPELRSAATVSGYLTPEIANLTGLMAGTPVVNAGHDHPCAGLGCGLAEPGDIIDSAGTSEALKSVLDRPLDYPATGGGQYDCYPHVVPGRFLLSGHTPASGGFIDWLTRLFLGPAPAKDAIAQLWAEAAAIPAGARGVRILPFLEGTGAPWNNRPKRAGIDLLDAETDRATIMRAGLESLSAWLLINIERFNTLAGIKPDRLIVTGGGARNPLANSIKAAMTGLPLRMPQVEETAGLGVALVAGLACGVFPTAAEAAALPDISWREFQPERELVASYAELRSSMTAYLESGGSADG